MDLAVAALFLSAAVLLWGGMGQYHPKTILQAFWLVLCWLVILGCVAISLMSFVALAFEL